MLARRATAVAAACGMLVSLLVTVAPPRAGAVEGAAPDWSPCPRGTATGPYAAQLECAKVTVPVDYRRPSGATIDIAISRLPSTDRHARHGVLLVNPGGPGISGLGMPAELADLGAPASVLERYDLVGFDPRGVGRSAPVRCGFTADQPYDGGASPYARDAADVADQADVAERAAKRCMRHVDAGTLRHLTTANTARDLDRIRVALGEAKISYYGASYGAGLGASYASLFGDRTDRVVLDSNLGDSTQSAASFRRMGLGAEQRFPDFARYAAARHDSYGLGRTVAAVRRGYLGLARRLDDRPVAGIDGRTFRETVYLALYRDSYFPKLARFWQSLLRSDTAGVEKLTGRDATIPHPGDNRLSAGLAVTCNDRRWPTELSTYQRQVATDRGRYPLYGAAAANITPCAFWPDPVERPVEISDEGPSNVLLLQNERDPSTPHVGGTMARNELGDRARLVTIDQGGHGVYLYNDNPCGLDVTTRFLVDGVRPPTDTHCPAGS